MTEQQFDLIIVSGNTADLAIAARAYAGQKQPKPVQQLQPKPYRAEFHSAQEFYDRGLFIPNKKGNRRWPKGIPAYGYTLPNAQLINRDRRPVDQVYACRHEPFHPIYAKNITNKKQRKLDEIIDRVAGGTAYQNRRSEIWCDAMVELFWGRGSILDDFYGDIPDEDLQLAWDIVVSPSTDSVVTTPPPLPLPLPDPLVVQLQTENVQLRSTIATLEVSVTDARAAQTKAEARAGILSSVAGYLVGDIEAAIAKFKERIA